MFIKTNSFSLHSLKAIPIEYLLILNIFNLMWPVKPFETVCVIKGYINWIEFNRNWIETELKLINTKHYYLVYPASPSVVTYTTIRAVMNTGAHLHRDN